MRSKATKNNGIRYHILAIKSLHVNISLILTSGVGPSGTSLLLEKHTAGKSMFFTRIKSDLLDVSQITSTSPLSWSHQEQTLAIIVFSLFIKGHHFEIL